MNPCSLALRTRVAAACQEPGAKKAAVAWRFDVSRYFVKSLVRQQQQTGSLAPKPASGGLARYLDAAAQAWLVAYLAQHPDATLAELQQACQASGKCWTNTSCGEKKSPHAAERDTERVRQAHQDHVEQVCIRPDVARFHFLDETGRRLDYARTHGRAVGGQCVRGAVPLRRGRSYTLIGTLSGRGLGALQLLRQPLNKHSFARYAGRCLAPTLRRGDVLVLDNLPVHHLAGLRAWLAKRGVDGVFLPPYSPDFSLIEQAWSKLKTKLRTCAARSDEALKQAVLEAIDWISSQDAQHWFDHCGYHTKPAQKVV
jgi:transposase